MPRWQYYGNNFSVEVFQGNSNLYQVDSKNKKQINKKPLSTGGMLTLRQYTFSSQNFLSVRFLCDYPHFLTHQVPLHRS